MRIGLYLDVAVGEALDGSGTWSDREIYVQGASIARVTTIAGVLGVASCFGIY